MPNEPMKPSDFVNAGVPYCSIFRETWHEITAVVVLQALVLAGDEWKEMERDEVVEIFKNNRDKKWTAGAGSAIYNKGRLERVLAVLASEKQAREFSRSWARVH